MTGSDTDHSALLARRAGMLAPSYRLFYEQPLQIVRAEGVWLYDEQGRGYLDAYNNVPVVGHCHPTVVQAICDQARTLNTHTRYLTEEPLRLAEELLRSFPEELGNVVFTCTGSEANDLAVQVSKVVTGGTGFIITDFAYHGATDVLAGMSPEEGAPLGADVYTVRAPLHAGDAAGFGHEIERCIERMRAAGVRPAALLLDTIFSSEGVIAEPRGFLQAAVQAVRAAGGLFIADEVQAGFGRLGEGMWGFERHGVVPDLVTMGKPMGNGHPIAALVGRASLLAQFARRRHYFNTYGGNNVSCAAARAVLKVIHEENLIQNALRTGDGLRQALRALAQRFPVITEVRGAGLFIGVELGASAASGLDAQAQTRRIVNAMRQGGVLLGATGRNGNVLKIRPPLTFGPQHADLLLQELVRTLSVS
ncbi:MAG: aspartate aminotransferase family protein [Steroidobacteraceae bacterium]